MVVDHRCMGSGKVEYTPGRRILHFGSPSASDAKKRALEEFYGAEVPDSTVSRVIMRDFSSDPVHPFVD